MEPARYDFRAAQGATFSRRLVLRNPDGTPMDLTGCTAEMPVTDGYGGAEVLNLSTSNDRITLGGEAGTVELLVSANDMSEIQVEADSGTRPLALVCVYDLNITWADGVTISRPLTGDFRISRAVNAP